MPTPATATPWDRYCARSYAAAAHPERSQVRSPDLLDFSFSLGDVQTSAGYLVRLLQDADECGAERVPTLKAHLHELWRIQDELDELVSEAERATQGHRPLVPEAGVEAS